MTKAVYRKSGSSAPKSGKRLMASVQSILLALSKWNRDLPDEIRFDPAKLSISRESVSTFAHYYQCINMVARPLLYHVVQKRLKEIRKDPEAKGAQLGEWLVSDDCQGDQHVRQRSPGYRQHVCCRGAGDLVGMYLTQPVRC